MSRFQLTMPFGPTDKVIELGGGDNPRFRPNVDIRPGPKVDFVCDLNGVPNLMPSVHGTYDGVYSQYALEHVSWRNVGKFIEAAAKLLKPNGKLFLIIPNLIEQAKYVLAKEKAGEFGDKEVCCIFGDQNYEGADWRANSHTAGFSPWTITKLLREHGFEDVLVLPHPETDTDMIVEARKRKPMNTPKKLEFDCENLGVPKPADPFFPKEKVKAIFEEFEKKEGERPLSKEEYDQLTKVEEKTATVADNFTSSERRDAYGHDYFNGGGKFGGYLAEGYWDYPVHVKTAHDLMNLKPESVLEIGPGRGYVLKRLGDQGVRCKGLEVSRHCFLTRVTNAVVEFDATVTPWPFKDKEFDLAFSCSVMEHIPEQYLPAIAKELERVCRRGFHAISFKDDDDGSDKTHCTLRDQSFWDRVMPKGHTVLDKEIFERGPIPVAANDGKVKLNIGCYTNMFSQGWVNIDVLDVSGFARKHGFLFRGHDVRAGLPYADSSVDLIFSSHMLEHLTREEGTVLLKECYRVMKPGATIRLTLPDAEQLSNLFLDGRLHELDALFPAETRALPDYAKYEHILWSGHQTSYNPVSIKIALRAAGFSAEKMSTYPFGCGHQQILRETQESLPELSLFVEAVK